MKWLPKKMTSPVSQRTSNSTTSSTRWGRKISLLIILVLISVWSWQKISNPYTFPIREVRIVDSKSEVNHELLRNAITPYLNAGMLWLDTNNLKNALVQIPWVDNISLRRSWPHTLIITVFEETPVAYWNNNQLLNKKLEPFNPGKIPLIQNLPFLNGPTGQENEVWNDYQTLNSMLSPLNLVIHVLSLTPRGAFEIELNNGMILILGREDVRTRLSHFISVYNKIFLNNTENVEYVDLRYSNGLAVKWKNNSTNTPATP